MMIKMMKYDDVDDDYDYDYDDYGSNDHSYW